MDIIQYPILVKARKQHKCNFCLNSINIGENFLGLYIKKENWMFGKHIKIVAI